MENNKHNLYKLNLDNFQCDNNIIIVGPKKCGKTYLIEDLLFNKLRKKTNYLLTTKLNVKYHYKYFINQKNIFTSYNLVNLSTFFEKQDYFNIIGDEPRDSLYYFISKLHKSKSNFIESTQNYNYSSNLINNILVDWVFIHPDTYIKKNPYYDYFIYHFKHIKNILAYIKQNYDCLTFLVINRKTHECFTYKANSVQENAAKIIHKGCENWIYKPLCNDNTIGINPRVYSYKCENL